MIHCGTPCSADRTPSSYPNISSRTNDCILPQISPQGSILSGGQVSCQNNWNSSAANNSSYREQNLQLSSQHHSESIKHESTSYRPTQNSCMFNTAEQKTPLSSINQQFPNHLFPIAGVEHLQLPSNGYMQASLSPMFSDVNNSILVPQSKMLSSYEPNSRPTIAKGRIKIEARGNSQKLPLLSGYISASNPSDLEDTISPLISPMNSLSPYLGSGISEIPSFPSIVSPINPTHPSRKRALSSSPLSDVCAFRPSPNSLLAAIYNNPMTTNGQPSNDGAVGHLVGDSNATLQYRVQQQKTSIEHNQNTDGTTNTTITNQITFSENPEAHGHQISNFMMDDQKAGMGSRRSTDHSNFSYPEDSTESHICFWEGCGLSFNDLDDLVQHIENTHIEKGRAEEYTCLWQSCIREQKPFNARYKLLIHMRIHSGEKPNKCTVSQTSVMEFLQNKYATSNYIKVMWAWNINYPYNHILWCA